MGREYNEGCGDNATHEDRERCKHGGLLLHVAVLARFGRVLVIACKIKSKEQGDRDVDSNLFGKGPYGGGEDNFLGVLKGRKATVPLLLAGCADDQVGPEHLESGKNDGGGDGSKGLCEHAVPEEKGQELEDHLVGKVIEQGDLKTTEARPRASLSDEVLDGGSDLGCYGLVLDIEELRLGGQWFLLIRRQ